MSPHWCIAHPTDGSPLCGGLRATHAGLSGNRCRACISVLCAYPQLAPQIAAAAGEDIRTAWVGPSIAVIHGRLRRAKYEATKNRNQRLLRAHDAVQSLASTLKDQQESIADLSEGRGGPRR